MQTQSDEHDDITKLLRDAFVRICQLAIADCGVSAAELTLHLSIQVNTGVLQVLSTAMVETVRSPLAKNRDHSESSAAGACETLNKSQHLNDNNSNSCRNEDDSFAVDHSFCSPVHSDDAESQNFNTDVAPRSLPCFNASKGTFTVPTDSQLVSSPVDANDVHSLILSEHRHGEVPLDEFLADVDKSSDCDEYVVSESPVALLHIGENKQEANKVYGGRYRSLSTPGSSEDSLVAVNGSCILSTLQSYDSDGLTQHMSTHYTNDVYNSDRQSNTGATSFLQHCPLPFW